MSWRPRSAGIVLLSGTRSNRRSVTTTRSFFLARPLQSGNVVLDRFFQVIRLEDRLASGFRAQRGPSAIIDENDQSCNSIHSLAPSSHFKWGRRPRQGYRIMHRTWGDYRPCKRGIRPCRGGLEQQI